jgi:hypothetical protein
MTKEEILRKRVCKDCIWEEMQNLVNTPMKQVYSAMDEYAKQKAIEFYEWAIKSSYVPGHDPEQLFDLFNTKP